MLALSEIIIQIETRFLGREEDSGRHAVFGKDVPRENKRVSWHGSIWKVYRVHGHTQDAKCQIHEHVYLPLASSGEVLQIHVPWNIGFQHSS